jgi:hypothetical protein
VRHVSFGEGEYDKTEAAIRSLLQEAGTETLGADAKPSVTYDPAQQATPETYLGLARAERFLPQASRAGTSTYVPYKGRLPLSHFSFGGTWKLTDEAATAGPGASLTGRVAGKDVYLVLSPPSSGDGSVKVAIDGKATETVRVTSQKLYHLFSAPKLETHTLTLTPSPGVAGYAFTFG